MSKPTEKQISDQLDIIMEQKNKGGSKFPGMTYEDGADAAIRWMQGDQEYSPMED